MTQKPLKLVVTAEIDHDVASGNETDASQSLTCPLCHTPAPLGRTRGRGRRHVAVQQVSPAVGCRTTDCGRRVCRLGRRAQGRSARRGPSVTRRTRGVGSAVQREMRDHAGA